MSAEIPDQRLLPNLYAMVTRCMLHANCSQYATTRTGTPPPCWVSEKNACSKRFPKEFCNHTASKPDFGYPKYRLLRYYQTMRASRTAGWCPTVPIFWPSMMLTSMWRSALTSRPTNTSSNTSTRVMTGPVLGSSKRGYQTV